MYKNLETLLLKAANGKEYTTELHEVLQLYGDDFNEIEVTTQLEVFSAKFYSSNKVTLRESIDYLRSLSA